MYQELSPSITEKKSTKRSKLLSPVEQKLKLEFSDYEYIEKLKERLGLSSNQEAIRLIIKYFQRLYKIS